MIETSQKEFENDQNRQIMQHWSNFLKNLHGKKTEDIETVLSNILEVISDLAKKGMMDIQEPETEDEKIFLNTFSVNLLKSVLSYHSKHQGIKHLQSQILEFYLDAFSRNMTNLKILPLSEQIANIFSDDNGVFRDWNGKDASETYLDSVSLRKRNGSQWEESISPGSYVDYLDKDMSATSANYHKPTGVGSWTRAMIRSIDQEGKVSLQLIGNGHIVDDIPLSSYTIAPLGTFSKDFEWRENLTTGQEIDYLDNRSWYRSTVLESIERLSTESNETRKYIKCAARIYRENGRCEDSKKRKYFGWGESFDVEISVHDPKIRRPNEFSKIIDNLSLITQYPIDSRKFNEIESYFPFDNENRFYIVPRKIEARHIDQLYFHLLNEFFIKCQGLEKILAALKSDTLNYDLMSLFIDIIYSLHSFMHITFAKTYLKEIVTATFSNLQKFANSEVRNFKRDKFETMIKRLREMMARVYVDVELNINYELFSVDFGLACLRSSILDKKLLGIKILTDILTEITRTGATNNLNFYEKHVNPVLLMSKVFQPDKDGQNIFDVLFGSQSHSQILQKSPDLLKTFFMGRVVSNKDIDKLFKIIQESTDQEIKGVIYKGISDNTQHMGNDLLTNLINKIFEIKPSALSPLDLQLFVSTFKNLPVTNSKDLIPSVGRYFFDLVFINKENPKIVEKALEEYISLLKSSEFKEIVLEHVMEILSLLRKKEDHDFIRILKVLRRIASTVVKSLDDEYKPQIISALVSYSLEEGKVTSIFYYMLEFLKDYHKETKALLTKTKVADLDSKVFPVRSNSQSHSDVMTEIVSMLSVFNSSDYSMLSFSMDQIETLYNIYVEDYVSSKDFNIFFKWLKEAEENKRLIAGTFEYVFSKMTLNENLQFSGIDLDMFQSLWNIFLVINKNSGLIQVFEYKGESSYSSVSSSGQTLMSYSYNPEKKNETEIKCSISPISLKGFGLMWKVLISCANNSEVFKAACSCIIKLFLSEEDQSKRGMMWGKLIDHCISSLRGVKCLSEEKKIDITEKKLKFVNILHILKFLIEESEKKGTAGGISHSSILKNCIITVKISNLILNKKLEDANKNFEVKVYQNTTLWDFKKLVGKKIGVIPEAIKFLISGNRDITENDHGKTLNELKVRDKDQLTIVKNPVIDNIPKIALMKDGKLADKAVKAFTEIFEKFSTDGKMNKEQCAQFAVIAVDSVEAISADDARIKAVYDLHDEDKDNFLDLKGFCNFFRHAIVEQKKPHIVWDNLKAFNYRNDLKKLDEPLDQYNTNIKIMPRFVLSKNQEYFEEIFNLQDDNEDIAKESSKLLSTICTNPNVYKQMLKLSQMENWNLYLEPSNYFKLLYSLQIIESFFEDFNFGNSSVDNEDLSSSILDETDQAETIESRSTWFEKFLTAGGLKHLINNIFLSSKVDVKHSRYRKCMILVIKIIRNSISILFKAKNLKNEKDEVIEFMRKESLTPESALGEEEKSGENANAKLYKPQENEQTIKINDTEKNLVETINMYYGDSLLKEIDFASLAHKLIEIPSELNKKQEQENEERILVNSSINLLSLIIVSQDIIPNFLHEVIFSYNKENFTFDDFILEGLLHNNLLNKLNYQKTFTSLSKSLYDLKEYTFSLTLLKILHNKITRLNDVEKSQSKYLFETFKNILDLGFKILNNMRDSKNSIELLDYKALALNIVTSITTLGKKIEEEILNGYIKILIVIVSNQDFDFKCYIGTELKLIETLIENFLINDNYDLDSEESLIDPIKFVSQTNNNKYSTDETRRSIFNLILSLTDSCSLNLSQLLKVPKWTNIVNYTSKLKKGQKYYSPSNEKRSMHGYAGLKNLQCICYMLSVLQQFFNVPSLRYAIMKADDEKPLNLQGEDNIDDNVLHQLQKMFVHLEMTQRSEYNPQGFCYAFKDLEGRPTNVSQQQDAQEFLGRLFDIVENSLKETQYKYLFQSVFLGKTCSQLICKGGCGKIRSNFEDFYNLSLEVQGRQTLKESLEKYISEDKIDDFFCETCNKKVSVVKRTSFAELPNVLIVHLQRIIFNYESFVNEKVNSRLEFLKRVSLKEFCTESIAAEEIASNPELSDRIFSKSEEYYEYELVGVVVHLGVAEAGHYYSYINVQRQGRDNTMNYDPNNEMDVNKWLTFNDSSVSSFLFKNLEEDCFGGSSTSKNKEFDILSSWTKNKSSDSDNSKNAYMLVYERVKKAPLKMTVKKQDLSDFLKENNKSLFSFPDEEKFKIAKKYHTFVTFPAITDCGSLDCENTAISRRDAENEAEDQEKLSNNIYDLVFLNKDQNEATYYLPFYSVQKLIPIDHFREVNKDNILFSNDQKVYSASFSSFLEKLSTNALELVKSSSLSVEESHNLVHSLTTILFEITSKSNFKDSLKNIVDQFNEIVKSIPQSSDYILDYLYKDKERLISELIFSSEENGNIAYKNLILNCILQNFSLKRNQIRSELSENNLTDNALLLLDYLLSLMPCEASKQWSKIFAYLDLFDGLIKSKDPLVLDYFFKRQMISVLIDFMLGKDSEYYIKGESRTEMGNRTVNPKFQPLISVISLMVRRCYTECWTIESKEEGFIPATFIEGEKVYDLSEKDLVSLSQKAFYKKAIKEAYYNLGLSRMLAHLMYNDFSLSKKRCFTILEAINEYITTAESKNAFDLVYNVLQVEDKFSRHRLEWILGLPQMSLKVSDNTSLPARETKFGEKIVKYYSPLTYGTNYESFLDKILSKYQASPDFITILNYLFACLLSKKHILNYFNSLPHPRQDEKRLKDYLFYLAGEEINRIMNIESLAVKNEKPIKGMTNIMDTYDSKLKELHEEDEYEIDLPFAPRMAYGQIVREHYTNIKDENLNTLNLFLLSIDYDVEVLQDTSGKISNDHDNETNVYNEESKNTDLIRETSNEGFKLVLHKSSQGSDIQIEDQNISNEAIQGDDDIEKSEKSDKKFSQANQVPQVIDLTGNEESEWTTDFSEMSNANQAEIQEKSKADIQIRTTGLDNRNRRRANSDEQVDISLPKLPPVIIKSFNQSDTCGKGEESIISNNMHILITGETVSRTFKEKPCETSIVVNAIKRYVVVNNSNQGYRIRFSFHLNDDFVNCYIPSSDIIVYSKKNSLNQIFVFNKSDINFPWSEVQIKVECEERDEENQNDAQQNKQANGNTIKKSNSYDNLATTQGAQNKDVPDCGKCGHVNMFSSTTQNYICQKCNKDVFG